MTNSRVIFKEDIPNEDWLQGKIDYALRSPRNSFGVPKMQSITGVFRGGDVLMPVRWAVNMRGMRDEQNKVREKDLNAIKEILEQTGKLPLDSSGNEYVPFIAIGYDGVPWINEGNHRIMAAAQLGWDYIPVEVRYFDGGQRQVKSHLRPENLLEITARVTQEREQAGITATKAFQHWFEGSQVVNASNKPVVMYHASNRDFDSFDRMKSKQWRGTSMDTIGSWFSDSPSNEGGAGMYVAGEGSVIYPVYLCIKNPKHYAQFSDFLKDIATANGVAFDPNVHKGRDCPEKLRQSLLAQGYDGISFEKTNTQEKLDEFRLKQLSLDVAKKEEWSVPKAQREPYSMKRERLEAELSQLREKLHQSGSSTEFDRQNVFIAFYPEQIKSAISAISAISSIDFKPPTVEVNKKKANCIKTISTHL